MNTKAVSYFFIGRKNKYSKEVNLQAVQDYLDGRKSIIQISKELSCNVSSIKTWTDGFRLNGDCFFTDKKTNKSYSKEFKLQVVNDYLNGNGHTISNLRTSTSLFMIYFLIFFLFDIIFIFFYEPELILNDKLLLNSLKYREKLARQAKERVDRIAREEAEAKRRNELNDDDYSIINNSKTFTNDDGNTLVRAPWWDFRTGQSLYQNKDGNIVEKDGNEVPSGWWD